MDSFFASHQQYHQLRYIHPEPTATFHDLFSRSIAPLYNSNIVVKDFMDSVESRASNIPRDGMDIRRSLTTKCLNGRGKITFLLRLQARIRRMHFRLLQIVLSNETMWMFEYMEVGVCADVPCEELGVQALLITQSQRSPPHYPEEEEEEEGDLVSAVRSLEYNV
jgi:hypothetical protein